MIGYKITAKNEQLKYNRIYDGWLEGSPRLESKAKSFAAKQVVKQIMTKGAAQVIGGRTGTTVAELLIGGPAGALIKVVDIVTLPLQGLGAAAGQLIADNLMKINRMRAEQGLMVSDLVVTLTGDFEGQYRVADAEDLAHLPHLLALIPEKGTTDQFMGEAVLEAALMAHVNFARHIFNSGQWDVSKQTEYDFRVDIDI
jgi:hypothetical protein